MSVASAILVFLICAMVIAIVGTRMTRLADRFADQTGLGEAFVGAVFLGAATSLPGITASVVAALDHRPEMALSNAIGGIAAQTAFLAIADITYRRANLEHAAVSVPNMLQAALLIVILSLVMIAIVSPNVSLYAIHPVTPLMFGVYYLGMRMVKHSREAPMWTPRYTEETSADVPDEEQTTPDVYMRTWLRFGGAALIVVVAGYFATKAISALSDHYEWMNDSIAGGAFIAVATSLPELVTSIAAVRRGALTLAVGGIIGGNCFDTLFAAVADIAYREGSLFHAAKNSQGQSSASLILVAVSIFMTAILLLGLLRRQKKGPAGIGFESLTVLIAYAGMLVLMAIS